MHQNQLLLIYQKEKNSRYSVIFGIFLYQQFHYLLLNRSNNVRVFIIFHTIHRPWKYWTQLNTLFVDGSGHLKTFCVHHIYIYVKKGSYYHMTSIERNGIIVNLDSVNKTYLFKLYRYICIHWRLKRLN